MNKKRCGPPKFLIPFIAIAAILLFGFIVMLLWNAILPGLLHVSAITYWKAVGLLVLCKILFGGMGKPGGGGHRSPSEWRGRAGFGPPDRLREKFRNMSEEEREKFKEEWKERFRGRCGH